MVSALCPFIDTRCPSSTRHQNNRCSQPPAQGTSRSRPFEMTATNDASDSLSRPSKAKVTVDAGEGAALRKRSRSRAARESSLDIEKPLEFEPPEDEDPQLREEGGYKGRQVLFLPMRCAHVADRM